MIQLVNGDRYPAAFKSRQERLLSSATSVVLSRTNNKILLAEARKWIAAVDITSVQTILIGGQIEEALGNYLKALQQYQSALMLYKKENPDARVEPGGIMSLIEGVKKKW